MHNGIVADLYKIDDDSMRKRRAESVKNVNRTNGKISFQNRMRDAYDEYAEDEDEWRG